jgi:hypothetical protein
MENFVPNYDVEPQKERPENMQVKCNYVPDFYTLNKNFCVVFWDAYSIEGLA